MSSNLEAKKQIVEEIKQKIQSAKSLAFVDYNKMTVEETTKMRAEFKKAGSEYKVYKNRLVMKALQELGHNDVVLEGTSAVALSYEDETSAPRIVAQYANNSDKLVLKGGMLYGKITDKATLEKLASIPSKEVLLAQLLSVLQGPTRSLAVALKAIAEKE